MSLEFWKQAARSVMLYVGVGSGLVGSEQGDTERDVERVLEESRDGDR
jgi:hypothetical protein